MKKTTKAYRQGFTNASRAHYWAHCYNTDIDKLPTLAEKVQFHNGYHDGLADRFSLPRPVPLSVENAEVCDLYLYSL